MGLRRHDAPQDAVLAVVAGGDQISRVGLRLLLHSAMAALYLYHGSEETRLVRWDCDPDTSNHSGSAVRSEET